MGIRRNLAIINVGIDSKTGIPLVITALNRPFNKQHNKLAKIGTPSIK
jgi:hypothetical protein